MAKKRSTLDTLVIVAAVVVVVWILFPTPINNFIAGLGLSSMVPGGTPPATSTCPSGYVANNDKKTVLTVIDPALGANVGTVSSGLSVYHNGVLVDTLSTSSGAATTSQVWPSGSVLDIAYASGDNYTWSHFTVPCLTAQQQTSTNNIYAPTIYSIGAPDSGGMQISLAYKGVTQTNASYFDASDNGTTGVLQIKLDNLNESTGFIAGHDFVNNYAANEYLVIYSYSTNVANGYTISFTGSNVISFTKGSAQYWVIPISTSTISGVSDVSALTRWKSGTTYLSTGSLTIPLTADFTALSATNLTITVRGYADVQAFQNTGNWGTKAATYGTFLMGVQP